MMDKNKAWFKSICLKNNFFVTEQELTLLDNYVKLLIVWNEKINLVSRRSYENIWSNQILPSISILFNHHLYRHSSIIDIGTGGGLPGIPLAILCKTNFFTLIDSISKKIYAVRDIIEKLMLKNVKVDIGRAEDLSKHVEYKCKFDYVIARAVAKTKDLIKWCNPFLKEHTIDASEISSKSDKTFIPRGTILLLKGGDVTKEIEEAKIKCQPQSIRVHSLVITGLDENDLVDKKLLIIKPSICYEKKII